VSSTIEQAEFGGVLNSLAMLHGQLELLATFYALDGHSSEVIARIERLKGLSARCCSFAHQNFATTH